MLSKALREEKGWNSHWLQKPVNQTLKGDTSDVDKGRTVADSKGARVASGANISMATLLRNNHRSHISMVWTKGFMTSIGTVVEILLY